MVRGIFGVLLCLCFGGAAVSAESIPTPRPKPVEPIATSAEAPLPRPKPSKQKLEAMLNTAPVSLEETQNAPDQSQTVRKEWPRDAGYWPSQEVNSARQRCEELLAGFSMIWRPDLPIGHSGGCGTPAPIAVSEVEGIRINPPATMNCEFAASLHAWIQGSLQPAARKAMGTSIVEIKNASSYACRRRDNLRTGKLSEHAFADALDISGFVFARKAQVSVLGDWSGVFQTIGLSGRGNFLRNIRKSACQYFNTVLGPGSDAFHKDHLHVDMMRLRPGRFKYCH
jgi:hypothetical protein